MLTEPGSILAERFELVRELGRGGMGTVWEARHLALDVPCAVKLILDEANRPDFRVRFEREARAAAKLLSPHVVHVMDQGVWEGTPYIVMELLRGEELASRLRRLKRLPPADVAWIVAHVSRALRKAHPAGIIHRDLKPDNIFICHDDDQEVAKVLDFGIAKSLDPALLGTSKTQTGALLGTPAYMSPEQAEGSGAIDHRSDLWSLAVIAFEALTGHHPFDAAALGEVLMRVLHRPIPVPSALAPDVPAAFDAWWARASSRDPAGRFQDARELSEELNRALGVPGVAPVSLSGRAPASDDADALERSPEPPRSPAPIVSSHAITESPSWHPADSGERTPPSDDPSAPDPFGIRGTVQARVFHVERAVAEGGFAVVYRANHDVFRAPVALKCLKIPETLTRGAQELFLEKFRSEAELLFRLSAELPEIVRPLQFGVLETEAFVPYLALEWLSGETLDEFVAARAARGERPLTLPAAIELLQPLARALHKAHAFDDQGRVVSIVHRDLKPENVFLVKGAGDVRIKLLDLGIARVRDVGDPRVSQPGDGIQAFSPAFAAPEQWSPDVWGEPGPWTDVYGFALTLLTVLLGRNPIEGELRTMMGQTVDERARPTPLNLGLRVPDAVERAFERALAVDPTKRTPSIKEFWTHLELAANRPPSLRAHRPGSSMANPAVTIPSLEVSHAPAPPSAPATIPSPGRPEPPAARAARVEPAAPPPASAAPSIPASASLAPTEPSKSPPVASNPAPVRPVPAAPSRVRAPLELDAPVRRERPRNPPKSEVGIYRPAHTRNDFGELYGGPTKLLVLAFLLGAAPTIARQFGQELPTLGPVKLVWIAATLGVTGLGLIVARTIREA